MSPWPTESPLVLVPAISPETSPDRVALRNFLSKTSVSSTGHPTTVTAGRLLLGGTVASQTFDIANTATLETKGAEVLSDNAVVNVDGIFRLGGNETISTLNGAGNVENEGHNLALNSGTFDGNITGNGGLTKNGPGSFTLTKANDYTGVTSVNGGRMIAEGRLTTSTININNGAEFQANAPDLLRDDLMVLANGDFTVIDETIMTLTGSGTVTADRLVVSEGNFQGELDVTESFTANRAFTSEGSLMAKTINVGPDGQLGLLGTYEYDRLQGTGTVEAPTLVNRGTVAPGGSSIGTLTINGNYVEEETYEIQVRNGLTDRLIVTGSVDLDLEKAALTVGEAAGTFQPIGWKSLVVDADGGIVGGYSTLDNTGETEYRFDKGTGNLVSLGNRDDLDNLRGDEKTILDAILTDSGDGVNIDTTTTEGSRLDELILRPGTGGISETLQQVSPAAYSGAVDLAMHSTRNLLKVAQSSPGVASAGQRGSAVYHPDDSSKSGVPNGDAARMPGGDYYDMEVFGGFTNFNIESEGPSAYEIDGYGGYAGLRLNTDDKRFQVGAFFGAESNSLNASGFDLDGDGFVFGGYASARPLYDNRLRIWSELAIGSYDFDGNHLASNVDFEASSFQAGTGLDYLAYGKNGVRVAPGLGLRYSKGKVDGFKETGSAGSMIVGDIERDSLWLDFGVDLAYQPLDSRVGVSAYLGYQTDLGDDSAKVNAGFAGGSTFDVLSSGVGGESVIYNLGVHYDFTESFQLGATLRGEFRENTEDYKGFNLQATYGF